ncbi:MAG: integrase [Hyphomicrobiales bacterium]|nr:integrase [Hyphomicrobiales bacterium]
MSDTTLTRFIGGSPVHVALRLLVASFIVGMLMVMLGIQPIDLVDGLRRMIQDFIDFGLRDVRRFAAYIGTGALIVVPLWLVGRLVHARRAA